MKNPTLLLFLIALAAAAGCSSDGSPSSTSEPSGIIAFTSDLSGNEDIYLRTLGSEGLTQLTSSPGADNGPEWHPNGQDLSFLSRRDGSRDIWLATAGGEISKLTNDAEDEASLSWSPSGDSIAFATHRVESQGFLWVVNADGTEPRPLLAEITPSPPEQHCAGGFPGGWSPDGSRIFYAASQGSIRAGQICTVDVDSGELTIVVSETDVNNSQVAVSPDGDWIAITSNRSGHNDIFVARANGDDLTRVTVDPGSDIDPAWSADSQWIAFASDRDGDYDIYIVRPDGSDLRPITDNDARDVQPAWTG